MTELSIRKAGANDSEFVFTVKKAAYREYVEQVWGWDDDDQRERHNREFYSHDFHIIQFRGTDVGFFITSSTSDMLKVNQIYILPEYQGRGIGSACMTRIIGDANLEQKSVILKVLKINTRGIALYQRLGFTIVGESSEYFQMEKFLKNRSIPREVAVEDLSQEEIKHITQTVFVTPDYQPADLLFVFGTSTIDSDTLESVACDCQQGRFPKIIVTGLSGRLYSETGKPVAHIMRDELIARGVPSDLILVQDRSTNTLEDVAFSLDVLEKHSISPESIAFLCKAHHSGRCLRTLRKFFPSQTLLPVTYLAEYEGVKVSKADWYQHEVSRGRVYGEYLRIIEYTRRGDIANL